MAEDPLFQRFGREFPKGTVLFRDGEPGTEMYVVQSGKVHITKRVRDVEKILVTLGPGEFFGEMSILNNKPRSAGAVVAEDAKLLVIEPKTFETMIRSNVEVAVRLIKKLSGRLQEADEQIENLLLRDPNSRVTHLLLRRAEAGGKATPQGTLLSVNPKELHSQIGLQPHQVEEAIGRLVKARILHLAPEGILVPDVPKMRQYLEFLEMKEKFGDV